MLLPFLKARRTPRVKLEDPEEIDQNSDDLDYHLSHELTRALEQKDVSTFRAALEALVRNAFEREEDDGE